MKIFYFIIFIIVFSYSSVVFAKTEVWKCVNPETLYKIDTDKPDVSIRSKDDKKWLSARDILSSVFIDYDTESESLIMYQQGRVKMIADLARRLILIQLI